VHPTVFYIDGKVGAEQGAQPAVDAMGIIGQFRGMVPFRVGVLGHGEDELGTELDTESASFAPLFNDVDDAMGHLDAVSI
jgi:hypothetical protein